MSNIVLNYTNEFSLILFYVSFFGLSDLYVKSAKLTEKQQILYYLFILFLAVSLMVLSDFKF